MTAKLPIHPHAFADSESGFEDINGKDVKVGDQVLYVITGQFARMDEALCDGDAFVTFDDGKYGIVKWHHLEKVTP